MPQVFPEKYRAGGDGGKNVAGQLRLRKGKEHDRDKQPAAEEHAKLQFEVGLASTRGSFTPPGSQGFDQSRANEYDPRNQCQHRDWKVVPEGFRMMVEITRETREVVLKNEFVKELGVGQLHGEIPGKRDEKKQNDSGNP